MSSVRVKLLVVKRRIILYRELLLNIKEFIFNTKAQNRFMLVIFLRHELLRNILQVSEIFGYDSGDIHFESLKIFDFPVP